MNINRFFILIFFASLIFSSCKKEVEGCTDTLADNYDAEASVSKPEDCTYQKRFTGDYTCTFGCKGSLAGVFQSADMNVSELAVKSEVNMIIQSTIGPIPVKGTIISKDSVKIDAVLDNLEVVPEIFFPGTGSTPIKATAVIKSTLAISSDNKVLSGPIKMSMSNKEPVVISGIPIPAGTLKLDDTCDFTGTKK
ncbi:MAG: hypothetical protein IPF52_12610 [Saprospiraceae bacterium]|nr:hypothetical protein [Saprospiraceae bacterium]